MDPFELTAMALDTLPQGGRALLLALLLSVALYVIGRALAQHPSNAMRLLFRKGTALVLATLPLLLWLIGLQMPVYVDEVRAFQTPTPAYVFYTVISIWAVGFIYAAYRVFARWRATQRLSERGVEEAALEKRAQHWSRRLGLKGDVSLRLDAGEQAWQSGSGVVLPQAARGWKKGLQDVLILVQLAHVQLGHQRWLLTTHLVAAMYWPFPWVKRLLMPIGGELTRAAHGLAASAYRDPQGWLRDLKQVEQRYEGLAAVGESSDPYLRLPGEVTPDLERAQEQVAEQADVSLKWAATRRRRAQKHFDPYERVYWLIAVVSLVVGAGTTLTIEQASPEMEPRFLQVRWQDQMGRRLGDQPEQPARGRPAAGGKDNPSATDSGRSGQTSQ